MWKEGVGICVRGDVWNLGFDGGFDQDGIRYPR